VENLLMWLQDPPEFVRPGHLLVGYELLKLGSRDRYPAGSPKEHLLIGLNSVKSLLY